MLYSNHGLGFGVLWVHFDFSISWSHDVWLFTWLWSWYLWCDILIKYSESSIKRSYFSRSCWCRESSSSVDIIPSLCSDRFRINSSVTTMETFTVKFQNRQQCIQIHAMKNKKMWGTDGITWYHCLQYYLICSWKRYCRKLWHLQIHRRMTALQMM